MLLKERAKKRKEAGGTVAAAQHKMPQTGRQSNGMKEEGGARKLARKLFSDT